MLVLRNPDFYFFIFFILFSGRNPLIKKQQTAFLLSKAYSQRCSKSGEQAGCRVPPGRQQAGSRQQAAVRGVPAPTSGGGGGRGAAAGRWGRRWGAAGRRAERAGTAGGEPSSFLCPCRCRQAAGFFFKHVVLNEAVRGWRNDV